MTEITNNSIEQDGIAPIAIVEEMEKSYLDYAMSVIVSRALPDVRDGLKPVHRRIVYAMKENGYDYNRPYRKSARIVGDVMGKYHPHGDSAIYETMVRMSQHFSMRLQLVDGQGNFGSMDGDKAAAMRYTEARLQKAAHSLIDDIDKDTVDFQDNYDETTKEPVVLPARFPNLLVNGAGGIAVGMATNIPPHNLGEVIDACCAYIENPAITPEELTEIIPGPDFPTGGIILGRKGQKEAYANGRGSVVIRAKCHIEEIRKDREAIIVTEIPYQVNKANMIQKIADMVKDKRIEGISDLRDESDRHGVRVVIEIKRDHMGEVVLNQLYKYSQLQTSFGMNMLALNRGRPEMLNLRQIIEAFVLFREEVIRRRTAYLLNKARNRAHTLVGLAIAVENIDEVIKLIRNAPNPAVAKEQLLEKSWNATEVEPLVKLIDEPDRKVENGKYELSEAQAKAILDLRLHRLTGLEREKIHGELEEIGEEIKEFLSILSSREKLYGILQDELIAIKNEYNTPRRTEIDEMEYEHDIEALIQREEMVVTVTNTGYIKRVPLSTYRAQRRGGKGRSGMSTKDEDYVTKLFVANTHTPVLFFSSKGMVYKQKVYKLPLGSPTSKGKPFVNVLPLDQGETITTIMKLPENEADCENMFVMFATASGNVRRNRLSDFVNVMSNGKIAMKLKKNDSLISVRTCEEDNDILLAARGGKCIRFSVTEVRVFSGRTSAGVRGIRLAKDDEVVNMSVLNHCEADAAKRDEYLKASKAYDRGEEYRLEVLSKEEYEQLKEKEEQILTISLDGYGKRSSSYEYRTTKRGGSGIANIEISGKNTGVVASFPVIDTNHIMLVTDAGKLIRMPVNNIRIAGRKTNGVILFRTAENEKIVSATWLEEDDQEEGDEQELNQEDFAENIDEEIDEEANEQTGEESQDD